MFVLMGEYPQEAPGDPFWREPVLVATDKDVLNDYIKSYEGSVYNSFEIESVPFRGALVGVHLVETEGVKKVLRKVPCYEHKQDREGEDNH